MYIEMYMTILHYSCMRDNYNNMRDTIPFYGGKLRGVAPSFRQINLLTEWPTQPLGCGLITP